MANNMEIIIREETSRKLRLRTNAPFERYLKNAAEKFCAYKFRDAVSALFTLLYEEDKYPLNGVLMKLNFTLYAEVSFKSDKDCFFIEKDSVIPIAEELQFQYMEAHPSFLKLHDYPQCEEEFEALKKMMASHPLLLHRAVNSVWHSHENTENVRNCIPLLLSEKNTSQAKGLEKLGINHQYQRLLIPFAKEIALFLKAMNNDFEETQRQLAIEEQKKQQAHEESHQNPLVIAARMELNSPFASLAQIWDKVPTEAESAVEATPVADAASDAESEAESNAPSATVVAAPTCEETPDQPSEDSLIKEYSVSPELSKLLDNKDALTFSIPGADEFWKQLAKLRNLGIDLNRMVDKLPDVLAILSAHEDLEHATDGLIKAEKEHDKAVSNYSKGNRSSLHALCAAGRVFTDAQNTYNAAYDSFVKHCDAFENAVA